MYAFWSSRSINGMLLYLLPNTRPGGSGISAFLPKCIVATYTSIYNFVRHAGKIFHVSLLFKCANEKGAYIIKREKFKDSTKEHERRLCDKGMDVIEKTT